jgi:hypothetical protein
MCSILEPHTSVPAPEDPGFRYPQFVGEQTEHEAVAPSALEGDV